MEELIKCELCGFWFGRITLSHLRASHGITTAEYQSKFPTSPTFNSNIFGGSEGRQRSAESIRRLLGSMSGDERKQWVKQSMGGITPEQEKARGFKISKTLTDWWAGMSTKELGEWSERFSEGHKNMSSEAKERWAENQSESQKARWSSMDPEERAAFGLEVSKRMKAMLAGMSDEDRSKWTSNLYPGPGKRQDEIAFECYLDSRAPGEWKFVGDFKVWIGRNNPDFIRTDGTKEVIEVFGYHWHDEDEVEPLIEDYKKFGYKCSIIWEYDCYPFNWEELDKLFGYSKEVRME